MVNIDNNFQVDVDLASGLVQRDTAADSFAIAELAGFGVTVEGTSLAWAAHTFNDNTLAIGGLLNLSDESLKMMAQIGEVTYDHGVLLAILGGMAFTMAFAIDKLSRGR